MPDFFARIRKALNFAFGASLILVSLVAGYGIGEHPFVGWILSFFVLIFCTGTAVLIHEIGHAAAAYLVGWRVHQIVVGPISYFPKSRKFRRAKGSILANDFGGWVFASPPPGKKWAYGNLVFSIGGPAANAIFAIAGLHLAFGAEPESASFYLALAVSEVSLLLALQNLIPSGEHPYNQSDGSKILSAIRGRFQADELNSTAQLIGSMIDLQGDEAALAALLNQSLNSTFDRGDELERLAISAALFAGDVDGLRRVFESLIKAGRSLSPESACDFAFATALTGGNASEAAKLLIDVKPGQGPLSIAYWRARAVSEYLVGGLSSATSSIDKYDQAITEHSRRLNLDEDDRALITAMRSGKALGPPSPRLKLIFEGDRVVGFSASQTSA